MRRLRIRNGIWIPCIALALLTGYGGAAVALKGDLWLAGCMLLAAIFFLLIPVVDGHRGDEVAPAAEASPSKADTLHVVDAPGVVSTTQREAA